MRKGEMREVEMWPGMVVSLIDRPWSRVLRAGRGRTSLAWSSAKEREGAGQPTRLFFFRWQLECHLHRHTESTESRGREHRVSKLVETHYPR